MRRPRPLFQLFRMILRLRGSSSALLLALTAVCSANPMPAPYPVTRQSDTVDDYHGVKVPDPYRWLEDDNSDETKAWVAAQNKVTFDYLEQIPERAEFRERLTKLWNYERYGTPFRQGGRYFYTHNTGLQNQRVLFVADSLQAEPRVLLDPNTLSPDGTVSLAGVQRLRGRQAPRVRPRSGRARTGRTGTSATSTPGSTATTGSTG